MRYWSSWWSWPAGRPAGKNTQIARYVAVEDEALKNRIAEEATIPWNEGIIKGAPVLMVMTYVEKRCGYERDGSFSTSKGRPLAEL